MKGFVSHLGKKKEKKLEQVNEKQKSLVLFFLGFLPLLEKKNNTEIQNKGN